MPTFVSDRRLYLNADKTAVVEEGDPAATHLLVAAKGEISQEDAEFWGIQLKEKPAEPTLLERERVGLEAALAAGPARAEEARFRRQRVADLEAADAAQKARKGPPATKQVKEPPADKQLGEPPADKQLGEPPADKQLGEPPAEITTS
jgi:hypothetical protein